ncbi:hypothetical protein G6F22_012353 [Rhizopus arrhizus]|nr:hypothetical protein G6F22_012353 [Rhizopus arrhizus]
MVRTAAATWLAPVSLAAAMPLPTTGDSVVVVVVLVDPFAVDDVPLPVDAAPFPAAADPFPVDEEPFPVAGGSSLSNAPPTLLSLPVSPTLPIGTSLRVSVMKAFLASARKAALNAAVGRQDVVGRARCIVAVGADVRHGAVKIGDARDVDAVAGGACRVGVHAIDGVFAEREVAVDRQRANGRAVIARRDDCGGVEGGGAHLAHARQHDFAADIHGTVQLAVDFQRAVSDQDGAGQAAAVRGQDHRPRPRLHKTLRALKRVVDRVDELAGGIGAVAHDQDRRIAAAADQRDGRALQTIPVGGELNARHADRAGAAINRDGAGCSGENGIAAIGQGAGGVGRAVPVRAGGAPGAIAAARPRRGGRAVAVPQVGRAGPQDEVDLLVAGQRLDGGSRQGIACHRAQGKAIAA